MIENIRHSLSHVLAMSVLEKFPKAKLGIGPVIENGFYYDFGNIKINPEDLTIFEKRMRELVKTGLKFEGKKISPSEAKKLFKNQPYKLELIKEFSKDKKQLTAYKSGHFIDLCKGGHIKTTKEINPDSFKLIKLAGAYWKGSEKNPMLTRIYGVAFDNKNGLEEYLKKQEEARRCDHRIIGEKLELFMIDDDIGKGLPLYLPNGYKIRKKLEDYIYNIEKQNGYLHVLTPHIAKEAIYLKSGHLAHYKEDMYPPILIDNERYYLKPMNCPHHHSIYKNKQRSYKELPLRIAEFGTVYRREMSGVVSGLIRMRGFTQNDAHIYTNEENLEKELTSILKFHKKIYDDLNIKDYWYRLSLPDFKNKEKFGDIKNKKMWQKGSLILKKVLKDNSYEFVEGKGEATFYGPKIDIQSKDLYGKEDTIATIQVDYYSASKFNLSYIDKNGKEKPAIIIHRAILGSFDRFMAFLIEKTCGNLPFWLSPVQVKVLTVSEKQKEYAQKVFLELQKVGIDASLAPFDETLGKKIREAEIKKIPYIVIIGEKETEKNTINIRRLGKQYETTMEEFKNSLTKELR